MLKSNNDVMSKREVVEMFSCFRQLITINLHPFILLNFILRMCVT